MPTALNAFLAGEIPSVDPHGSRLPPAPQVASTLGLTKACGLTAKAAE